MKKFKQNLDKSDLTGTQKSQKIQSIIKKLFSLKSSKPQLSSVIGYIIQTLRNMDEEYQNDLDSIEKLFDF
jgi:hypothetical protein